jgi:hypothetical protein
VLRADRARFGQHNRRLRRGGDPPSCRTCEPRHAMAGFISCGADTGHFGCKSWGTRQKSTSPTRVNASGKPSKRRPRSVAASSLNWLAYGWRRPPTRRPPGARALQLPACRVLRRDPDLTLRASSASIAARIHSRAMSNSLSRSSGVVACLASLTQSRANSSNSDLDDMGAPPSKVPFVSSR